MNEPDGDPDREPKPAPEPDPQGIWDDIVSKLGDFFGDPHIEGGRPCCSLPWHEDGPLLPELDECNVIPGGWPGNCKWKLVVVVNDQTPINDVLDRTLDHVSTSCKGTTTHVLINVVIYDNAHEHDWDTQWAVYEPEFTALAASGNGVPHVQINKDKTWFIKVALDKLNDPSTPMGVRVRLLNDPDINQAYTSQPT